MLIEEPLPSGIGTIFVEQVKRVLGDKGGGVGKGRKAFDSARPDSAADVVGRLHVVQQVSARRIDERRRILVDPAVVMPPRREEYFVVPG